MRARRVARGRPGYGSHRAVSSAEVRGGRGDGSPAGASGAGPSPPPDATGASPVGAAGRRRSLARAADATARGRGHGPRSAGEVGGVAIAGRLVAGQPSGIGRGASSSGKGLLPRRIKIVGSLCNK